MTEAKKAGGMTYIKSLKQRADGTVWLHSGHGVVVVFDSIKIKGFTLPQLADVFCPGLFYPQYSDWIVV